jgi:hypothetical protein
MFEILEASIDLEIPEQLKASVTSLVIKRAIPVDIDSLTSLVTQFSALEKLTLSLRSIQAPAASTSPQGSTSKILSPLKSLNLGARETRSLEAALKYFLTGSQALEELRITLSDLDLIFHSSEMQLESFDLLYESIALAAKSLKVLDLSFSEDPMLFSQVISKLCALNLNLTTFRLSPSFRPSTEQLSVLAAFIQTQTNLMDISLPTFDWNIANGQLSIHIPTGLKNLKVPDSVHLSLLQRLNQLQELDITCENSRSLNGDIIRGFDENDFPAAAQRVRNLEKFSLRLFTNVGGGRVMSTLALIFPSLTKLKLDTSKGRSDEEPGRRYIRDSALQSIIIDLPNLKSLSLKDCAKVTDTGFTGIGDVKRIQGQFYCGEVRDLNAYSNILMLSSLGE